MKRLIRFDLSVTWFLLAAVGACTAPASPNRQEAIVELKRVVGAEKTLTMRGKKFTDGHLRELKKLKQLRSLTLLGTAITDAGLAQLKELSELRELILSHNLKITDAGLVHLKDLIQLEELSLFGKPYLGVYFTDVGIAQLKTLTSLKKLHLETMNTPITPEGLKELRLALPNCQIRCD